MFTLMNAARLGVGMQGLGIERVCQIEVAHVEPCDHLGVLVDRQLHAIRSTHGTSLDWLDHRNFESLVALATLAHFELHRLALFEGAVPIAFDVREVHEHVGTALS